MGAFLIIIVLLMPQNLLGASPTAVRIQLLDTQDVPVVGVTLTVRDQTHTATAQTDPQGVATIADLSGAFLRVLDAVLPDGTRLRLDATTLDEGLRFGLLPGQERQVVLRRDGNLLFLDPATIFAGNAPDPTSQASATLPTPAAIIANPVLAPAALPLGLIVLIIVALPVLGWFVWWLLKIRAYQRSRR